MVVAVVGTQNIRCCIIIGIPKRDHDFDNHPYGGIWGYIGFRV